MADQVSSVAAWQKLPVPVQPGPWYVKHRCSGCGPEHNESAGLGLDILTDPEDWDSSPFEAPILGHDKGLFARSADACAVAALPDRIAAGDRMAADLTDAEARADRAERERDFLLDAIGEYALWRPGEKGHAAAHRRLIDAGRKIRGET